MKKLLGIALLLIGVAGLATIRPVQAKAQEETTIVEVPVEENPLPEWAQEVLDPRTVSLAITLVGNIAVVLKLANELKKTKKQKTRSNEELAIHIENRVIAALEMRLDAENRSRDNKFLAVAEKLIKSQERQNKIALLAQENTPQSRLAIVELISEGNDFDKKLIEEARETIYAQQKAELEKKEQIQATLKEVLEETETKDKVSELIGKL